MSGRGDDMEQINARRLAALRERLAARQVEAVLVTNPDNVRYLSGFTGHEASHFAYAAWLVISSSEATLVTDFRYYEAACAQAAAFEVRQIAAGTQLVDSTAAFLSERAYPRLGFEAHALSHALYGGLTGKLGGRGELVSVDGLVDEMRAVKDERELAAIRTAVELTDAAYQHAIAVVRPGMTERELAWAIERYMREHGAEGMAFGPAVAAGPNSGVPHHVASDRPIRTGEPIWLDLGARVDGYCADLTRTICLGEPDARYREIWEIVLQAQLRAEQALRSGMLGQEADALARDYIADAGYAEAFGHSLGHGVGLAIHERPRLSRTSDQSLAPGMVVTVEPGIYLSGWGGVRIEDLVVVGSTGVEVLSQAPKSPIVEVHG